jgi:hypothetical protein
VNTEWRSLREITQHVVHEFRLTQAAHP